MTPLFAEVEPRTARLGWDEAGQVYQALAAVERARRGYDPDPRFASVLEGLALKRPMSGQRFDSPHDYTPEKVRRDLGALLKIAASER